MKSPLQKDLAVSLLGHIGLIAIIIIVNPATGVLRGSPEVMTVGLADLEGPAPAPARQEAPPQQEESQPEPEPIDAPEIPIVEPDASIDESFKLASNDSLETIIDEPEPKPEPEPEEQKPEEQRQEEPQETHATTQRTPPPDEKPEPSGPKEVTSSAGKGLDITTVVGEGDGSGGSGSGGFGLPYNISLLERKIERNWRNPVSSSNLVTCTVYFQVGRDGQLIGRPVIEKSSAITTFDNEAIYAIMRVDRFPAFPSGFDYDYVGIHLDFTYDPQER